MYISDQDAPVRVKAGMEIESSPDVIWKIMAGLEKWPEWNPEIKAVRLEGPLEEGAEFRWKAGPGVIRSRLKVVDEPTTLAWTGSTFGIRAVHVWNIKAMNGKVLVTTEESWDGFHVRLFRKYFRKILEKSIRSGLKYLKTEAERRDPGQRKVRG